MKLIFLKINKYNQFFRVKINSSNRDDDLYCVFQAEKVKKVEFESDEPLADYLVMKDIKDVVDQIAHIPLAERKRLFETRVVDVDDIADFVAIQDNEDAGVFAASLRAFEESVHSVQQDTDKID